MPAIRHPLAALGLAALVCCLLPVGSAVAAEPENDPTAPRPITLHTKEGVRIEASLAVPLGAGSRPAVVLIHQGGSDRGEWLPFCKKLVERGYVCLAYDVRGHGASAPVEDVARLFDDPDLAPRDLVAALAYLRGHKQVDPQRVGVVGSSIGANLAYVATSKMGVKTAVAISGKTSAAVNLAGGEELHPRSVFSISSAGDQEGRRAKWARELYERTEEPRRLEIVEGSSAHGVSLFEDAPELEGEILDWLAQTL